MKLALKRTATGKQDPELTLLQRKSLLELTALQIAVQINVWTRRVMECCIRWPGLHNHPTSTQFLGWVGPQSEGKSTNKCSAYVGTPSRLLEKHSWWGWLRECQECAKLSSRQRVATLKNLKSKIYFDFFNTFLVTTWFDMCYFIVLMSSPQFMVPTIKFGRGGIMFWGCFMVQARPLSSSEGISYRYSIHSVLPTLGQHFEEGPFLFQHDNVPVNNVRSIQKWFVEIGVEDFDWPAQSPDLIPIKHLLGWIGTPTVSHT